MRATLVLTICAACSFSPSQATVSDGGIDSVDAPPDTVRPDGAEGSARRKQLSIDDTKVTGAQTAFPVWIVVADAAGLGARALADGSDLYFTLPDGTPLEWERVAWDQPSGHLEAWVRLDLADTTRTDFELRYGDPGPAHAPNAAQVWTNGFAAVWHLDQLAATTPDAAGERAGTAVGINTANKVPGTLAGGVEFAGANQEITFANPITGGGAHTFSAWVKVAAPANGFSSILTLGNPMGNQARWWHTNFPDVSLGFFGGDWTTSGVNIDGAGPTLMHWVFDPGTDRSQLFRNGQLVGTSPVHGNAKNTQGATGHIANAPLPFGPGGNAPNPLAGVLDEVRIATTVRTAGWIATEHANQSSPATFYTVGPDQAAP
ncbi:MAG: LamG-like jellyroll fold domain-containing protein [Kofleriaceae bacterium]